MGANNYKYLRFKWLSIKKKYKLWIDLSEGFWKVSWLLETHSDIE